MTAKQPLSIIPENILVNKIYEIRGHKVMLDSDLAALYGVETSRLNEQVKRNLERFPTDFMFQITEDEWKSLISQIATSKNGRGGRRKLPNVFTEHGVLMLSSVLNSQQAIQVNIQIVRIFTRLRQWLSENGELKYDIEEIKRKLNNQDKNIPACRQAGNWFLVTWIRKSGQEKGLVICLMICNIIPGLKSFDNFKLAPQKESCQSLKPKN